VRSTDERTGATLLGAAAIAVSIVAAYGGTFAVPFVLDDHPTIERNPTIRALWPLTIPLSPPGEGEVTASVGGRPLVNLTFALNYAASGLAVRSYHAVNLAIHVIAALVLFGVVRRTLTRSALSVSLAVALLWALHPLQTESVTYLTQRAESLAGLFYLLTLYCFIRSTETPAPTRWRIGAVVSCLLGMASKEVMVSAPLVVLLYDRTFVAGSFGGAWRLRRGFYLALFGTWIALAYLAAGTAWHGSTAGFHTGVEWWAYALTQCEAIVRYLRLALWPSPLVFDYGIRVVRNPLEVAPQAALLMCLITATAIALRHRLALGFAGAVFFALLAPTSSVVPIATQTIAEHRMYLPLALLAVLAALGVQRLLGARGVLLCFLWAAVLGVLTFERNGDYRSEYALWTDTVAKNPSSARAHSNLGKALLDAGRTEEAFGQLVESLRVGPELPAAHFDLGLILERQGRSDEAREHYAAAVRLNPKYAEAHINLGVALMKSGDAASALPHLEAAVALAPDLPESHCNLANAFLMLGRLPEAAEHFVEALRLRPDYAIAHANYGRLLQRTGRLDEAETHLETALRIDPTLPSVREALESVRSAAGNRPR
jgi:tetratricopeptide (TPR) repeat protein